MRRTFISGAVLALVAALLADHGGHLGLETGTVLYGIALGAVLGLARDGGPVARACGFASGFVACWLGYAVRAGVLPDIPAGRAIAAAGVVLLVTAVAAFARVPLWAGLLGIAALAGAYETTFTLTPTAFTTESVTAATTVLLAAALAFVTAEAFAETGPPPEPETTVLPVMVHQAVTLPEQRPATTDTTTKMEA